VAPFLSRPTSHSQLGSRLCRRSERLHQKDLGIFLLYLRLEKLSELVPGDVAGTFANYGLGRVKLAIQVVPEVVSGE
jgi:hypothetical protein